MNQNKYLALFEDEIDFTGGDLNPDGVSTYHNFQTNISTVADGDSTSNDTFWACVRNTENRVETSSGTDIFVDANKLSRSDLGLFVFGEHDIIDSGGSPLTVPAENVTCATSTLGFGATEGMIILDLDIPSLPHGNIGILTLFTDSNNFLGIYMNAASNDITIDHKVSGSENFATVLIGVGGTSSKIAIGWAGNQLKFCANGGAIISEATQDALQFQLPTSFNYGRNWFGLYLNSITRAITTYDTWGDTLAQERTS